MFLLLSYTDFEDSVSSIKKSLNIPMTVTLLRDTSLRKLRFKWYLIKKSKGKIKEKDLENKSLNLNKGPTVLSDDNKLYPYKG
jgi:hypothetical protein